MKKVFLSIVAIAALVALPMSVSAQTTVGTSTVTSQAVTGKAKIIQPIKITLNGTALDFGTIASAAGASVVTLTPANGISATGGATIITTGAQFLAHSVPGITVNGEKNAAYNITINTSPVTLTGTTPANTMTVDNFTTSIATTPFTGNLGTSGEEVFTIGAKLNVGANQPSDVYTGSFTVTAAYN